MSATSEFERSITIDCDPAEIYAELSDPQRLVGLQPLLVAVTEIEGGGPNEPRVYDAVEAVGILGPVRWRNRVRVRVDPVRPDAVIDFEAHAALRVSVRSRFALTRVDSGTRVCEAVRIESPRWLGSFVVRRAVRAQEALLANLKRRLEARTESG